MGSGKTSWAIQTMNESPEERFIFVSPYLKEVERIIAACPALCFRQPTEEGMISKTVSFQILAKSGENIAMTHELLARQELTPSLMKAVQEYGYTLILDEVLEVVQQIANLGKGDAQLLFDQGWVTADAESGLVKWKNSKEDPTLRFKDIRAYAENRTLIWYHNTIFLWLFPLDLLQAFRQVYMLTFQFEGSHMKHYLDLHQMPYEYFHIQDGEIIPGIQDLTVAKQEIQSLLTIYDGPLNDVGNADNALSKNWFKNGQNKQQVKILFKNARNMLMNRYEAKSEEVMWTCFRDLQKRHGIKGYAKGFCSCNVRATNDYRQRIYLAYLLNVYDHPVILQWFGEYGIRIDQDAFALNQLLQWIWRSGIREGKAVNLYIPSQRMRKLLQEWLGKTTA